MRIGAQQWSLENHRLSLLADSLVAAAEDVEYVHVGASGANEEWVGRERACWQLEEAILRVVHG